MSRREQDSLPFRQKIPGQYQACELQSDQMTKTQCCYTCKHYRTAPMASPGGWCLKYLSRQVNTGDNLSCPAWEKRAD